MIDFSSYEHEDNPAIHVVDIEGNLDGETAEYFFKCIEATIDEGRTKLIVNCVKLEYISSLGLAMLMRVHARMKKLGGDVRVARLEGVVADALSISGFDKILKMYPSVGDAAASFG